MTTKLGEVFCLVCSSHSSVADGIHLLGEGSEKIQTQFHKVLKAPVPKKPPSDIICKRCDRTIRRLATETGESAEREIEYLRKIYRKTVTEYNAKAEIRRQKLRKAAEAFMLPTMMKAAEKTPETKVTIAATRWKLKSKSGSAFSKLPLPVSSDSSSPKESTTPKPDSGATTPQLVNGTSASLFSSKFITAVIAKPKRETDMEMVGEDNTPEAKNTEKSALVKHDSLEEELQDTDTQESAVSMPFFKKKAKKEPEAEKPEEKIDLKPADVPEVKPAEDGTATVTVTIPNDVAPAESNISEKPEQPAEDEKKMADEEVKPISVKDAIKEIEAADGGNEKPDVAPGEEPNGKVTEETKDDAKKEDKKENTPLIEKESKVKDTGPGCLCCHIL